VIQKSFSEVTTEIEKLDEKLSEFSKKLNQHNNQFTVLSFRKELNDILDKRLILMSQRDQIIKQLEKFELVDTI
jgi:predicted  nucleic acid-binding Zn-ribbon protein